MHLIKFYRGNSYQRIFLTVDSPLLQCIIKFAEIHRGRVGPQSLELLHNDRAFHRPEFKSFKIIQFFNFLVAGKIFKPILINSQPFYTIIFKGRQQLLSNFSIKYPVCRLFIRKQERKVENLQRRAETADSGCGQKSDFLRPHLYAFKHFPGRAQLSGWKDIHQQTPIGLFFHPFLKFLRSPSLRSMRHKAVPISNLYCPTGSMCMKDFCR